MEYGDALCKQDVPDMETLRDAAKGVNGVWWESRSTCSPGHAVKLMKALDLYEASQRIAFNIPTPSVAPTPTLPPVVVPGSPRTVVHDLARDRVIKSLFSALHGLTKPENIPFDYICEWTDSFTTTKLGSGGFGDVYEGKAKSETKSFGKLFTATRRPSS